MKLTESDEEIDEKLYKRFASESKATTMHGVNGFGSSGNNASVRKDYMSRVNITLLPWQPNFAAVLAFHEGCTICNATNCSSSSEEYSEIYLQCVNIRMW